MIKLSKLVFLFTALAIVSCQSSTEKNQKTAVETTQADLSSVPGMLSFEIGDRVPNDLVCMVNNAYMGKKQFEVPFEGKTYYGCCNMCVERIPNDKAARTAIDPSTSKEIDKSEAYIVLVSGEGHVAYFENEQNYKRFLAEQ